jgi:hypothetical protein
MRPQRWRPEPTTNTMLVLLRDTRRRIRHVVIGSALLDADWEAALSELIPEAEAPALVEFFCHTPLEGRRAYRELCELGDVDPEPADFEQEWFPAEAGLATVNWLLAEVLQPRSKTGRLLGRAAREELDHLRAVLLYAEAQRLHFHLVEVQEREGRRFAGREITVRPRGNALSLANGDP